MCWAPAYTAAGPPSPAPAGGRADGDLAAPRTPSFLPASTFPSPHPGPTPHPTLTERDSVETVSTIRGPSVCRWSSSWVFCAAWEAGRIAQRLGWEAIGPHF